MNDDLYSVMEEINNQEKELHENMDELISDCMPSLKPGIKLLNTNTQWTEADLFFRAELPISEINELSANECILKMTNTVYDYFAEIFGTVKKSNVLDDGLHNKYANYTKQELKHALKELKRNSPDDIGSIRYVSKQLHNMISGSKPSSKQQSINHDEEIKKNFWKGYPNIQREGKPR